ncbi:MAG: 2-amino-4-hydroxy-6-hydroxymethyldihydropteridine diphosphokinase [Pseudomonadota bacterium]
MIVVALGSSQPFEGGPPPEVLRRAAAVLRNALQGARLSPVYRSPAWPDPADPPFANAVMVAEEGPEPEALLDLLIETETRFGRRREVRNAPRTLDLDLIDHHGAVMETDRLILPHPCCGDRDFVLRPLLDLEPLWRRPGDGAFGAALLPSTPVRGAEIWC